MIKKIIIGSIVAVVLLIFGAILHAALQPKPYSWSYSLETFSKQPYGAYVLKSQLPNFFPGKNTRDLLNSDFKHYYPYVTDYYDESTGDYYSEDVDSTINLFDLKAHQVETFNFIGISPVFEMSMVDIKALLLHVYQGNEALLLANRLSDELRENLGIETRDSTIMELDEVASLFNIQYRDEQFYSYKPHEAYSYIKSYPEDAEVIARNRYGQVLGIQIRVGKGKVTYFSMPILFSNYYLLKGERNLSSKLLKQLAIEDTYLAQYSRGRYQRTYEDKPSLMSFIHSKKSLSWSFYTLLFSILLFMLFRLKRLQRVIPLVNPPENTSLKYAETLSNLYLMHNNHKEAALKKMNYFFTHVRQDYNLDVSKVDEDFYKKLSAKSQVDIEVIRKLFIKYHYISARHSVTSEEFISFCKLLQHFKN